MAAEYTGSPARCRTVSRTTDSNGVVTEHWGDFVPTDRCISAARPTPNRRSRPASRPKGFRRADGEFGENDWASGVEEVSDKLFGELEQDNDLSSEGKRDSVGYDFNKQDIPMFDYADGDSDDFFGADGDCQIMMNAGGFDDVSTGDMYAEGRSNTYIALRNISKWSKKRNRLVHPMFAYYTKGEKVTVIGAALKMREGLFGENNFFRTSDGHFVLTKELAKDAKQQFTDTSSGSSDSLGSQRRRRKVEEVTNFRDMQLGEYIVNNTNKGYSDITAFDISDTGRPIKSTGKKIANGSTVSVIEKEKVGENYFFKLSDGKYLSVRAKKHLAKKPTTPTYNGGSFFRKDGFLLWQRDKREPFYQSAKVRTKELQPVRGIEGVWRLKINGGAKKDDFAKLEGYPDFFVLVSDLLNSRKQK